LYDILESSGLVNAIIAEIPTNEMQQLTLLIDSSLTSVYNYLNSVRGILESVSQNSDNTLNNLELLKTEIANIPGLETLVDITKKLG
jgi:hypothetical protein